MLMISILIPVFNEKHYIKKSLDQCIDILKKTKYNFEIIISDNCSFDGTKEIIENYKSKKIIKLFRKKNEGKGSNLIDCIKKAKGDYIIFFDSDLEYNVSVIPDIISCFEKYNPDSVFASRFMNIKYRPTHGLIYYLANLSLTFLTNILFNKNFSDVETGVKAFKKQTLNELNLISKSFDIENEICAKLARMNKDTIEIPVEYYPRKKEEGKKVKWYDFFKALISIIKWRFIKF